MITSEARTLVTVIITTDTDPAARVYAAQAIWSDGTRTYVCRGLDLRATKAEARNFKAANAATTPLGA